MDAAPSSATPESVSANLRMILHALLSAMGAWRLEAVLARVLYRRINRTMSQIERMLLRFRAGRLWRVARRETVPGLRAGWRVSVAVPRRFGWLVQAGGHQAAGFGSQLQAVLNAPEMADLLAASAQARRMLRPICRALAVELPKVVGASTRAAPERCERQIRKMRHRAIPEPSRVPLPRGVLAAARRQGFGKDR